MSQDGDTLERTHVLCVSGDRQTRALLTRSLAEGAVSVAITTSYADAIDRLEYDEIDSVVVDTDTIWNASRLLERLHHEWPGTPAFVYGEEKQAQRLSGEAPGHVTVVEDPDRLPSLVERQVEARPVIPLETVVNQVKRRLADARSAGEIERAVREGFSGEGAYAFAWLGEYDPGEREIIPWVTDRSAVDWPIHRSFSIGGGDHPLLERALKTGDSQVVSPLEDCVDDVPLGETALERGVHTVSVSLLETDEERYGVFVLYARHELSESEQTAIASVTDTTSYALESVSIRGQVSQLSQSLNRYERLVEAADDGMYVVDSEGHFTTVNDALLEMTEYSREGVLGEHYTLLFDHGASRPSITAVEASTTFETQLETKSGERIPCETQAAAVTDDVGDANKTVGVVRDITDRKRRERQLREQNERLDAFAQIVSHDLRNPLGVAQGYLELAVESGEHAHLEQVSDGLDRMETIIADVLTVAREGEWAGELETVDLQTLAETAWENVDAANATLVIEDSCQLEADRSPVLRLFENLFRNAIEHGQVEGEPLTIRVGVLNGYTESGLGSDRAGFYVADDGEGVPPGLRDEVFDSTVSTGTEGIGLGLWVVREVAHGHGWSVLLTESADGGARFEFEHE